MRSIILHIHDDDCLEARYQAALDLTRRFDGHLTCLQAMPYEVGMPGDLYGTMAARLIPDLREASMKFRKTVEARLMQEDVSWNWIAVDGPAAPHLARSASLNDLLIVGARSPEDSRHRPSPLVGELAVHANTPLLVVPETALDVDFDGAVLVAWNGSSEAAHALRAAVPLLKRAGAVFLAVVAEEKPGEPLDLPPTDGAEFLSRHDIGCEIVDLPAEGRTIAETLSRAAGTRNAAYIVMGAYGHSRLRQTVFGGVTRALLAEPGRPLFMCH